MNKKLNVCLINDSFPPLIDGVANTVTNYAKIINSGLGKAAVATPYYPDSDDSEFDFPVVRFPSIDTTPLVGYRAGVPFSSDTIGTLTSMDFDIIHSHCPVASSMLGRVLRDAIDKPLIFTYHTKFDIDIHNSIRGRLLQEGATKMLVDNVEASDEVWAVSEGAGKNLQSLGYEGDYIVMHNGVDFPKGRVSDEYIQSVTEGLDLPEGVPVYLFVGRMMWYKGVRITLDALEKLKGSGQDFRMVFIGGGGDKDEIMLYSQSLKLDDKVFFVDSIGDRQALRAWYCRADLFLFPSTFDTNGLVVREAAACALPSVLVRGSCASEDTEDYENSFWIDENSESMFTLLKKLGSDIQLMEKVGRNAQDQLYLSWEDSVKAAYERYHIVLDRYMAGGYEKREAVSDQFFQASAGAIKDILQIQDRRNRVYEQAKNNVREILSTIDGIENTVAKTFERIKYANSKLGADMRTKFEESREALLREIDRYR